MKRVFRVSLAQSSGAVVMKDGSGYTSASARRELGQGFCDPCPGWLKKGEQDRAHRPEGQTVTV